MSKEPECRHIRLIHAVLNGSDDIKIGDERVSRIERIDGGFMAYRSLPEGSKAAPLVFLPDSNVKEALFYPSAESKGKGKAEPE